MNIELLVVISICLVWFIAGWLIVGWLIRWQARRMFDAVTSDADIDDTLDDEFDACLKDEIERRVR